MILFLPTWNPKNNILSRELALLPPPTYWYVSCCVVFQLAHILPNTLAIKVTGFIPKEYSILANILASLDGVEFRNVGASPAINLW